jgi:pyruvate dehydrogenase complex dehydrogenase (E1) component
VRGNGKIIQELEAFFRGAGWNVIKVIWGREWDGLLHADRDGALINLMNTTPDGDYQTYKANDGAYVRDHFFGRDPRTKALVEPMSDADIWNLKRGGHDYRKVHAAYKAAMEHSGQPTVILAKTIKGYGLGSHFAGRNATHQMKKLSLADLKEFRDSPADPDHRRAARGRPLPAALLPPRRVRRRAAVHARAPAPARRAGAQPRRHREAARAARRPRCTATCARGRASRTSPRRWRSSGCCASSSRTRRWAAGSCRSSRTRRARSGWTRCSRRRRSTTRTGSSTPRWTPR